MIVLRHGATHNDQADTDPLNLDNVARQRQLNDKARADARALVAAAPNSGTNTLIVTHRPNILDALGRDWFDVREGETSIFEPDGAGGYTLVGRAQIGQWTTAK